MMNKNMDTKNETPVRTFCTGRFLIDLPAGSQLSGGNYQYAFARIEAPKTMGKDDFEREVLSRATYLRTTKHDSGAPMLIDIIRPDHNSAILVSWNHDASTVVMSVTGYRWMEGRRFSFSMKVDDDHHSEGLDAMRKLLFNLRSRPDDDIPSEPGYCFEGGFIANPEWENEEAGIDIDIAGHPDAYVSVWFYPLSRRAHSEPLLDRVGGVLQMLGRMATSVHVLRRGERQVGPYKGQEFLVSAPNSGGLRGHSFIWETEGEGTLDTPALKIELTTGHHDKNSNAQQTKLSDAQAIRLWDEVLNSFRLRPTQAAAQASITPP